MYVSAAVNPPAGTDSSDSFENLYRTRIPPWLLYRLSHLGFHHPTTIQRAALDVTLPSSPDSTGADVVIHAQTGSGKTLAYLLPAISAVVPERARVQALIIVPTQELGMQVYKLLRRLVSVYGHAVQPGQHNDHLLTDQFDYDDDDDDPIGDDNDDDDENLLLDTDQSNNGVNSLDAKSQTAATQQSFPVLPMLNQANLRRQKLQLRKVAPRIIVGNPHRVAELVKSRRLRLDLLKVLVVDEFDACLNDTTTTSALQTILSVRNRERQRQTMLASATVPQHRHFLRQCSRQRWTQQDIKHVWLDEDSGVRVPTSLKHMFAIVDTRKKIAALRALLIRFNRDMQEEGDERRLAIRAMIFVMPSRNVADIVDAVNASLVEDFGLEEDARPVEGVHNEYSIGLRREAVVRFRTGEARILVGTDVAARGLDFEDVTHVIHFDVASDADGYLHRAGRTGRQGRHGTSVMMVTKGEEFVVRRTANTLGIEFSRVGR